MDDDESIYVPPWLAMASLPGPLDSPPPPVNVEVGFGAQSRGGAQRSINDDHYLIMRMGRYEETLRTSLPAGVIPGRFDECGYGMVIADGMAEAASRVAVSTLVHLAIYFGRWNVRVDEPIAAEVMDRAERFYRTIDSTLLQAARSSPGALQSTLTAVYTAGAELFFAHVGDSRAYMFRDGELLQLTRDHTRRGGRPAETVIMDLAERVQRARPILSETLGKPGPGTPRIDVERCGLLDGDVILLCTNGLTSVADDVRIAGALRSHRTPDDQCGALMDLVASAEGPDDATAVVAHYHVGA